MKRSAIIALILLMTVPLQPVSAWGNSGPSISLTPTGTVKTTSVSFTASASDSDGVKEIWFYIDGTLKAYKSCKTCGWTTEEKCGWVKEKVQKCGWKKDTVCERRYTCWDEEECEWRRVRVCDDVYKCWDEEVCDWVCEKPFWCWWCDCEWKYKCENKRVCDWVEECTYKWKQYCWTERKCGYKTICEEVNKWTCWYEYEDIYKCWDEEVYKCSYPSSCSLSKTETLSGGSHSVKVEAYDAKDAKSSKTYTVTVDLPPSVSLYPSSGTFQVNNPDGKWHGKVSIRASDDVELDWVKVYVDGSLIRDYDCNWLPIGDHKHCNFDQDLALSPGYHTIRAVARDTSGQRAYATATYNIKIDYPPSITVSPDGGTYTVNSADGKWHGSMHVKATDDIELDWVKVLVDGSQVKYVDCNSVTSWDKKNCEFNVNLALTPGEHHVETRARDTSGHTSVEASYFTIKVDNPPSVSITPPSGTFTVNNADGKWHGKVSITASDDIELDWVKVYVDGRVIREQDCNGFLSYDKKHCNFDQDLALSPGSHTVRAVARDTTGQQRGFTASYYVKYDKPPSVTVSPDGGTFTVNNADGKWHGSMHIKATDDIELDWARVYVDGTKVKEVDCNSMLSLNKKVCEFDVGLALTPGEHHVRTEVRDTSGLITVEGSDFTIKEDAPPSVSITPATGTFMVNSADGKWHGKVSIASSDDIELDWVKVYVDGSLIRDYDCNWLPIGDHKHCNFDQDLALSPGYHTIRAVARDTSGHEKVATASYYIKLDNPPSVSITPATGTFTVNNPDGKWHGKASVSASDDIELDWVKVSVNGKVIKEQDCNGLISLDKMHCNFDVDLALAPGSYTVEVEAKDTSGLSSVTEATYTVKKDEPPRVNLVPTGGTFGVNNPDGKWHGTATVFASDDVELDWIRLYVDGSLFKEQDCNGLTSLDKKKCEFEVALELSAGEHTVKAVAKDTTGNTAEMSGIYKVVPDIRVEIQCANKAPYFETELPVTVSITKAAVPSTVRVFVDGAKVFENGCDGDQCSYTINMPLTGLANKYMATKSFEFKVDVDVNGYTTTKTKTITVSRGPEFKKGANVRIYFTIDKGDGPVTELRLTYDGRTYSPAQWPDALSRSERTNVKVPFDITITDTDLATIQVCNPFGCDAKQLSILTGEIIPPTPTSTPTVTTTITPTPTTTVTPTPTPPPCLKAKVYMLGGGHGGINYFEFYFKSLDDGKLYNFLRISNGILQWINPPTQFSGGGSPTVYGYVDTCEKMLYYWDSVKGEAIAKWSVPNDVVISIVNKNPELFVVPTPTPTPTPTPGLDDSCPESVKITRTITSLSGDTYLFFEYDNMLYKVGSYRTTDLSGYPMDITWDNYPSEYGSSTGFIPTDVGYIYLTGEKSGEFWAYRLYLTGYKLEYYGDIPEGLLDGIAEVHGCTLTN